MGKDNTTNSAFDLRSITNPRKEIGNVFRDWIRLTWGFNRGYEKLILVAMAFWTVYSLFKIFVIGC